MRTEADEPTPVPSPKRAVTTGRPIARKEPKLISSTTIAAKTPIPVSEPGADTSVCFRSAPKLLQVDAVAVRS
jgi:hypothetical protein